MEDRVTLKATSPLLFRLKNLVFIFLLFPLCASGQKYGLKAGLNAWELGSKNSKLSFHAGVFLMLPIAENMAVMPELNYSSFSAGDETLRYLHLPIVVNVYETKWLFLQFGMQYGRLLSADLSVNSQTISIISVRNRNDFALVAGIGSEFGKFILNIRYNWGLLPVIPNQDFATISIVQGSIGLKLN